MHRSSALPASRARRAASAAASPGLSFSLLALAAAAAAASLQVGPLHVLLPSAFGLTLLYLAAWRHPNWMPALLAVLLLGAGAMVLAAATQAHLGSVHLLLAWTLALWLPVHFWADALARASVSRRMPIRLLPLLSVERERAARFAHRGALAMVALSVAPIYAGAGIVYGLVAMAGGLFLVSRTQELARQPCRRHANATVVATLVQMGALIVAIAFDQALG